MGDPTDIISGIDPTTVAPWLSERIPGLMPPLNFDLVAGGRSNLTYLVTDAEGRRIVLRRPPLGNVLQSAHDVVREHRIIAALAPTSVLVPAALAVCEDPAVTGAPFYAMDFVEGAILRDVASVEDAFAPDARAGVADALVDALADLHAIEPDDVGLGDLGRRTGLVERQLRRWQAQFERSRSREVPAIDEVHRRLSARIPAAQRTSIVHGDYRLDNCVIDGRGRVAAILDWELCTLGDPLADVGLLGVYWTRDDALGPAVLEGAPTSAPGFPPVEQVLGRYAERSGLDLGDLDFYVALGFWKLACIVEGVHARYAAGVMGDDGATAAQFGEQVLVLAERALQASDGLR